MENICELHLRLKHCLQTIIDLEMDILAISISIEFSEELDVLKKFINKIEKLDIKENDVLRLEKATEKFLRELQLPLSKNSDGLNKGRVFH